MIKHSLFFIILVEMKIYSKFKFQIVQFTNFFVIIRQAFINPIQTESNLSEYF
jgi:hypothetical protein